RNVAILLFDDVEVLDFCGPFEVFGVTGRNEPEPPFRVGTVAEKSPIAARNGLSVNPAYSLETCPPADILLVPGGWGTRREMHNARLVEWVRQRAAAAELVLSVCTGALILGQAGLLDGLEATTHFGAIDLLRESAPHCTVTPARRFVDNGRVITSAGISAGIDMSLHVVARLLGKPIAEETARYMEYRWERAD
ncbi:MAG: DJ-1/PfpI family protein, partial [Planctomycetaceae bacterium]|nr:DJ-1/PfpI family protein [Planctomycetaceae bacterium]